MASVAANVAANKERHPENYCPTYRCLWRTSDRALYPDGRCPRHPAQAANPYPPIPRERNEPTGE